MNEAVVLAFAVVAGALIGTMFFGGLWWTVQKGLSSDHPALWFLGSQLLRTSIALAAFYVVSDGHWERLLMCIVGFIIARATVSRLPRPASRPACQTRELNHAP